MKFIYKPKCRRNIMSWRSYCNWYTKNAIKWFLIKDYIFPFKIEFISSYIVTEVGTVDKNWILTKEK